MNSFLHIGEKIVLQGREVIGIFRHDDCNAAITESSRKNGMLRNTGNRPKSFILVKRDGKHLVYQSKISAGSLIKRINASEGIDGKTEKNQE